MRIFDPTTKKYVCGTCASGKQVLAKFTMQEIIKAEYEYKKSLETSTSPLPSNESIDKK
jgi:hypothetical protein